MVNWLQASVEVNFLDMEEAANKFGKRFAEALEGKRMAPAELARKLGVSPQRMTHWKNRGVAAKYAARVGEILGVNPEHIASIVTVYPPGVTPLPNKFRSALDAAQAGVSVVPGVIRDVQVSYGSTPQESQMLELFRQLSKENFVKLVIQTMPDLAPDQRIEIARAALVDRPTNGE